jgi:FlaA1/EpsC-like NDP-sugar epimerase
MKSTPFIRNRYLLLGDLLLIVVSVFISYALRLDLPTAFPVYLPSALFMIGVGLVIKPLVYYFFGLYRRMWIYASIKELKVIAIAVTSASLLVAAVMIALFTLGAFFGFPRSILIIDWLISLAFVGGLRFSMRVLAESQLFAKKDASIKQPKRALIIGAGDAGALVVKELEKNPQLLLKPVGFLDDNPAKQKQRIYDIPVVGTIADIGKVLDHHHIAEVIIAIPSASGKVIRLVTERCREKGIPFRTMPGIYELLGGQVNVSRLREVDIADLLRRQPTRMHDELIGSTLGGKTVLVTGAGGSIGSELCRQIARWKPRLLILLGHGENSIFESLLELTESFPDLAIKAVIADVRDKPRLLEIFDLYHPEVVFHAAAHKHVPLMEVNVEDAVTNNVLGTLHVVEVAAFSNVEKFVLISTDKAILPANVMGATKRIAEMIVLDAANRTKKAFSVVRFGNVLGSRGSVVPLFKRQIAKGGPITVTHPKMKRYFMTIPEAVYLVLQAASMGKGGDAYVLNMGEQIKIVNLAEDLIRLSGLEPGKDIEIQFTGIRPGEKLSEDLKDDGHVFEKTSHPEIYQLNGQQNLEGEKLAKTVTELIRLAREGEPKEIIRLLDKMIPGSHVSCMTPPDLTSID